jgi:hypothetical protein
MRRIVLLHAGLLSLSAETQLAPIIANKSWENLGFRTVYSKRAGGYPKDYPKPIWENRMALMQ